MAAEFDAAALDIVDNGMFGESLFLARCGL